MIRIVIFFLLGKRNIENVPPTSDALELPNRRVHCQTAIWLSAAEAVPELCFPLQNRWYENDGHLQTLLIRKDSVPKVCSKILTCNSKSCVSVKCTCWRNLLKCIGVCRCNGAMACL